VDLDQFPLCSGTLPQQPTVLFVGSWSYRKGADVLTDALEKLEGVRLIHVGPLTDVSFPYHPRFVHHEPVAQSQLRAFYEAAHVFVLASREDGFGVVLCQALASGLPVVCTDRTGGPDLARLPGFGPLIRVVPAGDSDALRRALSEALDDASGKRVEITNAQRQALGWRRYALEHLQLVNEMVKPYRVNMTIVDRAARAQE
jgi:glycosyltransferase involved in cell wall biosynthesis